MKKVKSEIRSTKFETKPKFEYLKFKTFLEIEFWRFEFVSTDRCPVEDFGFRISSFAILIAAIVFPLVIIAGCTPGQRVEEPICAGKAAAAEAIAALRQKQPTSLSFRATVDCVMEFADAPRETFDGQLRFVAPDRLYLGGDKFGPIRIGTNEDEFWVYIKPGADTAWWGKRKDVWPCAEKLGLNLFHLAEVLGQIDLNQDWTLMQQPGFDILVAPDIGGIRKVYINCCTYRVERIEYCDVLGKLIASADMSDYRDVPQVGAIPRMIELRHFRSAKADSILRLKLSGISFFSPTPAQQRLFERPEPKGYKSVYQWTESCEFVADTLPIEGGL